MATPAEVVPFAAPDVKTDLKPIRIEANNIVAQMGDVGRIRNEAELQEAAATLARLEKQVNKPADAVRRHLNEPIAEAKKRNDQLIADTLTVPGEGGESRYLPDVAKGLRDAICGYVARIYERDARRTQRALERLEEKADDGELSVVPFVPGAASPKRTIRTAEGSVSVGTKLRFSITDPDALPEHVMMRVANEKAIAALLEAGQDVPGVTAVIELNTTVR